MQVCLRHPVALFCVFILAGAWAAPVSGVTIGFTDNFDSSAQGTTLPSPWVEAVGSTGTTADYAIVADPTTGNALRAVVQATSPVSTSGTASNVSAAVEVTDAAGSGFSITSSFTLESFTAGASDSTLNFGLVALGSTSNFTNGTNYRLLYTPYSNSSTSRYKLSLGENGGTTTYATGSITATAGLTGTLTLTGTYDSNGTLTLLGTMVSGSTTLTVIRTDTTPLEGTLFGYRTALNARGTSGIVSQQTVDYDDFAVQPVPEPTFLAGVLAAVSLLLRRQRRGPAGR